MIAIMLRDKLDRLVRHKVDEPSQWAFQSQIRYYIELSENVKSDNNKTLDFRGQRRGLGSRPSSRVSRNQISLEKIHSDMTQDDQTIKE